jgi:cyclic beta-1,2-glucan synthetase
VLRAGYDHQAGIAEGFPTDYLSFTSRRHRWIRGDWQNLGTFLRGQYETRHKRERMSFGFALGHQVFRSVLLSLLGLSLIGTFLSGSASAPGLALSVFIVLMLPNLIDFLAMLIKGAQRHWRSTTWCASLLGLGKQSVLKLARLTVAPHQALIVTDAIVRASIRLITRRHLLDWKASSMSCSRSDRLVVFYQWALFVVGAAALVRQLYTATWVWLNATLLLIFMLAPFASTLLVNRKGEPHVGG